ncbi:helix-turn-helix domain-containing protein [Lacrimispora celerecrescens]|uniref:Excisionase family DNA binding protein n=1 Tax=[Clostridium] celerecrescens 18A TaxID=1286362 RepID=A0A2M8Z067_9FIRM|nr:helix-turn-helix domain-containing protein [Lacrimispora celerecrescens]PJJ26840.1 excisionase family DNA binding protein [[Clostridium] celerecrescens 18A]
MREKYYSVEQISEMLNIHPKTIQRYIREGKLRAGKIGKSWRVTGHDLSVFMESTKIPSGKETSHSINKSDYEIKVSSVIDIDVEGMDDAIRIMNTVTAALNTNLPEYGHPTMHAQFLESECKVRVTIWGNIQFAQAIIQLIMDLVETIKQEDYE